MGLCSVGLFNKFENVCSGKTTLLKILAGKHMVGGKNVVQVLSRSAFHDTQLVCSGDLSYLGGSWSKTVGSAVSSPYSSFCFHFSCFFVRYFRYLIAYRVTTFLILIHLG